jgi:hypothetical protein
MLRIRLLRTATVRVNQSLRIRRPPPRPAPHAPTSHAVVGVNQPISHTHAFPREYGRPPNTPSFWCC